MRSFVKSKGVTVQINNIIPYNIIIGNSFEPIEILYRGFLKFRYVMITKETLRPFSLVIMYFLFHSMSGLTPIKPNMVNVTGALGMPDDGKNIVVRIWIEIKKNMAK